METSIINKEKLRHDRLRILESLNEDPETVAETFYSIRKNKIYSPYLYINKPLLCCLLKRGVPTEKTPPLCLVPFRKISQGTHGEIYYVGSAEESYIVKIRLLDEVFIYYMEEPEKYVRKLSYFRGKCGFPENFTGKSLASDNFTNEVLVSYILDYLLEGVKESGLNNVATTYIAGVCDDKGLILMERGNASLNDTNSPVFEPYTEVGFSIQGQISIFGESFVLDVLRQLVILFSYLNNWNFVHGDLKISNVIFSDKPYMYHYGEGAGSYSAEFTVKIIDFEKSSITFSLAEEDYRFYNYSSAAYYYLKANSFAPKLKNDTFTLDHFFISQIYADARHDYVPYYSSFDLYTLIISMVLSPSYFFSFSRYPELITRVWRVLFDDRHFQSVYEKVYRSQGKLSPDSMDDILSILKNVPLKCNLASLLYESLFA